MVAFGTVGAIGRLGAAIEFGLRRERDHALVCDQPGEDADRERAAAEAEGIDLRISLVVAAQEFVEVQHIALQSPAEHAAEDGERLERRGADAVRVAGDLIGPCEVERLKNPPDVGTPDILDRVSSAVGQKNDSFRHGLPLRPRPASTLGSARFGHKAWLRGRVTAASSVWRTACACADAEAARRAG